LLASLFFGSVDGVTVLLLPLWEIVGIFFCFANLFFCIGELVCRRQFWCIFVVFGISKEFFTSWAGTPREVRFFFGLHFWVSAIVGTFFWCGVSNSSKPSVNFFEKLCVDTLVFDHSSGLERWLGISDNGEREKSLLHFG
jgi:hypothetical protein